MRCDLPEIGEGKDDSLRGAVHVGYSANSIAPPAIAAMATLTLSKLAAPSKATGAPAGVPLAPAYPLNVALLTPVPLGT